MRLSTHVTVVALLAVGPLYGQVTCIDSSSSASALSTLFSGVSSIGSFSLSTGERDCSHTFEKRADVPSFYETCESWMAQKATEELGRGVIAGIEVNDGKSVDLGSSNLGVSEVLSYRSVNSSRTSLKGKSGLDLRLLGKRLKLPRQPFSAEIVSDGTSHLGWEKLDLDVDLKVPTPYGRMEIGFGATFDGTVEVSDRAVTYTKFFTASAHDWSPYRTPSWYWDKTKLRNNWRIQIASPPLGKTVGGVGAELRLVLAGDVEGRWFHGDPNTLSGPSAGAAGPQQYYHSQLYSGNRLEAAAGADARIRGTIKIWRFRYKKEWTIVDLHTDHGADLDTAPGRVVVDYYVSYKPSSLSKCPPSPVPPADPAWIRAVISAPPSSRPDDPPTDLTEFATDVTETVNDRYYLCDGNGHQYDPTEDPALKRFETSFTSKSLTKAQIAAGCAKVKEYFLDRFYLCERVPNKKPQIHRKPKVEVCDVEP